MNMKPANLKVRRMLVGLLCFVFFTQSGSVATLCSEAKYLASLALNCPKGSVISDIIFAAFDTSIKEGVCKTGFKQLPTVNYNSNCDSSINVMGIVGTTCLGNQNCTLAATRNSFGFQMSSGECKSAPRLMVNATCTPVDLTQPQPSAFPICGGAVDGGTMHLSCSLGQGINSKVDGNYVITDIQFAGYGRPIGECLDPTSASHVVNNGTAFRASACDSINTLPVIQAACLNKASCTMPVSSTSFSWWGKGTGGWERSKGGQDGWNAMKVTDYCGIGGGSVTARWLFVQASCSLQPFLNEDFFYSTARASTSSQLTLTLSCPLPNQLLSSFDLMAFGEPTGQFISPIDAAAAVATSTSVSRSVANASIVLLSPRLAAHYSFHSYWNDPGGCDCLALSPSLPLSELSPAAAKTWSCALGQSALDQIKASCQFRNSCSVTLQNGFTVPFPFVPPPITSLSVSVTLPMPIFLTAIASCESNKYSQYKPAVFIQGRCFACPSGSFYSSPGSLACSLCPEATYSTDMGSLKCLSVPPGAQATTFMNSGVYAPIGAVGYTTCSPGLYRAAGDRSTGGGTGTSASAGAVAGAVAGAGAGAVDGVGAAGVTPPQCLACSDGTISTPFPLPTACTACDAGQRPTDRLRCTDCPLGFYAAAGDNICTQSPAGAYPSTTMGSCEIATSKASGYSLCPAGSFNPQSGTLTCSLCGLGTFSSLQGASVCKPAPPGTFVDAVGSSAPVLCPPKFYSAPESFSCKACAYPSSNNFAGSAGCPNVSISTSNDSLAAILVVTTVMFAACIASAGRKMSWKIFVNVAFPALDVFSDLAYLLTNIYHSYYLFALSVCAYVYGVPYFASHLIEHGALPYMSIWPLESAKWLGYNKGNDPIYFATYRGQRILGLDSHSNIFLVLAEVAVWAVAIAAQVLCLMVWPFVSITYFMFMSFWFILGAYFHMTKVLSIGRVWNIWVFVWRGWCNDSFQTDVEFDTEEHNRSLRNEFFFETAPQLLLQVTNNSLTNVWSPVAIFSVVFSAVMAVNGIYRLIYFTMLIDEKIPLYKVPTGNVFSLRLSSPIAVTLTLDTRILSCKKDFSGSNRKSNISGLGLSLSARKRSMMGRKSTDELDSPLSSEDIKNMFFQFFLKYMPLPASGDDKDKDQDQGQDQDQEDPHQQRKNQARRLVSEIMPPYLGCEDELLADVCLELYGTHPRELLQGHRVSSAVGPGPKKRGGGGTSVFFLRGDAGGSASRPSVDRIPAPGPASAFVAVVVPPLQSQQEDQLRAPSLFEVANPMRPPGSCRL